jgi:hypothetical protein
MTSREHARRLMLILLSSPATGPGGGPDGETAESTEDRQGRDAHDDSSEDDRARGRLVETLMWA